jgi:uncharacterized coiled-coil protein SlyX
MSTDQDPKEELRRLEGQLALQKALNEALAEVRADITRTTAVVDLMHTICASDPDNEGLINFENEENAQGRRLLDLLTQERELLRKAGEDPQW